MKYLGSISDSKDLVNKGYVDDSIEAGLEAVFKWLGVTTTSIADGSSTNPIIIDNESVIAVEGSVVGYNNSEFLFDGSNWKELGKDEPIAFESFSGPSSISSATTFTYGSYTYYKGYKGSVISTFPHYTGSSFRLEMESSIPTVPPTINTYDGYYVSYSSGGTTYPVICAGTGDESSITSYPLYLIVITTESGSKYYTIYSRSSNNTIPAWILYEENKNKEIIIEQELKEDSTNLVTNGAVAKNINGLNEEVGELKNAIIPLASETGETKTALSGKNVFNPSAVTHYATIDPDTGEQTTSQTDYCLTGNIFSGENRYATISYVNSVGQQAVVQEGQAKTFFYSYQYGYQGTQNGGNISIPSNTDYIRIRFNNAFSSVLARLMVEFSNSMTVFEPYYNPHDIEKRLETVETEIASIDTDLLNIIPIDLSDNENVVEKRWYSGNTVGEEVTSSTVTGTKSYIGSVTENEQYIITCVGGGSGRAFYTLDSAGKIVRLADINASLTSYHITINAGESSLIVQTNTVATWEVIKNSPIQSQIDVIKADVSDLENDISLLKIPTIYHCATKYGTSALVKMKVTGSGIVNIGFIGDSWTQGTEDSIVSGQYETYVKWLSKKLWADYGFGGLGWLDFSRDSGSGKMFGCSDLYEHWNYSISGNISGLDGSTDASAPNCLGICCAHPIFASGAKLTLTFNAGYLDKFKIAYYKDAHFSISVNGGAEQEITANSSDGWQETEIGVTGTDITSVVITALGDSIIFGMNCDYGTTGVKCHKIGNRSMKLTNYLLMNETQFETGLSSLDLSWVSLLFAINDIGGSTSDSKCEAIIDNFTSFINRVKTACTRSGLMSCDISILGCANISNTGFTGLPKLEEYEHQYAITNNYGWVSTRECIGASKDELAETGLFSDTIHMNKAGCKIYGDYIYRKLFRDISVDA